MDIDKLDKLDKLNKVILDNQIGELFIVPTPIGNLEDMTFRAINTLKSVDYILAEDTRHSKKLLNHFNIQNKLVSYYKEVEEKKLDPIIFDLKSGKKIALISDAGTPGISDPGNLLIINAIKNNIKVTTLPGSVAFIPAIVASGLVTNHFIFYGFLSHQTAKRKQELNELLKSKYPVIFYESPHRIKSTLEIIEKLDNVRNLILAREISKLHEEFLRGNASYILENLNTKGEMVLIIDKMGDEDLEKLEKESDIKTNMTIKEKYSYYENLGMNKKDIIKQIAKDLNVHKSEIYKEFI